MNNRLQPVVGQWYAVPRTDRIFCVIGFDPEEQVIDLQDYEGDIDELDVEEWRDLHLELAAAPEDWTGPMDDIETDDLGYTDVEVKPNEWNAVPVESLSIESWDASEIDDEDAEGQTLAEALAADALAAAKQAAEKSRR